LLAGLVVLGPGLLICSSEQRTQGDPAGHHLMQRGAQVQARCRHPPTCSPPGRTVWAEPG